MDDYTRTLTVQMANEDAQFLCTHARSFEVKLTLSQSVLTPTYRAEPVETVEEGLLVKCYFSTRTRLQSVQQLHVRLCQAKSWDRKHTAIEELPATMVQRVLPSIADFATELPSRSRNDEWYKTQVVSHEKILELDQIFQQEAADAIMRCPPGPPFLLTGPFGTGKTRLIARLTHQILHTVSGSRVLISTHHNQTADTYPWNFFVKLRNYRLPCTVYRLVRDQKERLNPQIIHNVLDCSARQMLHYHRGENVRLVVTTNETALRLIHDVKLPSGYFTHIFIDEAAQCIEPDTLAPLLLAGPNTKVILAGDHLQVNFSYMFHLQGRGGGWVKPCIFVCMHTWGGRGGKIFQGDGLLPLLFLPPNVALIKQVEVGLCQKCIVCDNALIILATGWSRR